MSEYITKKFKHKVAESGAEIEVHIGCLAENVTEDSAHRFVTDDEKNKISEIDNSILCTEQTLTDDQKAQARTNIGACASDHTHDEYVKTNDVTWKRVITADDFTVSNGVLTFEFL